MAGPFGTPGVADRQLGIEEFGVAQAFGGEEDGGGDLGVGAATAKVAGKVVRNLSFGG